MQRGPFFRAGVKHKGMEQIRGLSMILGNSVVLRQCVAFSLCTYPTRIKRVVHLSFNQKFTEENLDV